MDVPLLPAGHGGAPDDGLNELLLLERLGEVVLRAASVDVWSLRRAGGGPDIHVGLYALLAIAEHGVCRQSYDGRAVRRMRGLPLADARGGFEAAPVREIASVVWKVMSK